MPLRKYCKFDGPEIPCYMMDYASYGSAVFLALGSTYILPLTMAQTTEAPDDGGGFFDDDNNKAMFLVLPAMIIIYGSCCLIYCIHKCRRYCVNKKKRKLKAEKKRMKEKERQSFSNALTNTSDESNPMTGDRPSSSSSTSGTLTLECLENGSDDYRGRSRCERSRETDVDSLEDVLQTENIRAVSPGYQEPRSLTEQMQHLDNQLKAAFRLTHQDDIKKEVPPAAVAKSYKEDETKETQRDNPKIFYDDASVDIHREKRKSMRGRKVRDSEAKQLPNDIPLEDLKSIASVRNRISKEMPKSMPDVFRQPDENAAALRKITLKDGKRRIYLSSQ